MYPSYPKTCTRTLSLPAPKLKRDREQTDTRPTSQKSELKESDILPFLLRLESSNNNIKLLFYIHYPCYVIVGLSKRHWDVPGKNRCKRFTSGKIS